MKLEFTGRRFACAAGFAIALSFTLAAAALASQGGSWTYTISAATTLPYEYRIDTHSYGSHASTLGPGYSAGISGARTLSRHTSLVLAGNYRSYSEDLGLFQITETPPTTGTLQAQFFSVGAGLRIQPWSDSERSAGPYAQILPALFVSRWEETTVEHEGYDMLTGAWRAKTTHTDSFMSAQPGVELSAGLRMRIAGDIGTDIALRYTRSADLGEHALGRFSSGDFRGLDEVALAFGLTWSP